MRTQATSSNGDFRVRVIAGTRTILIALDCDESRRKGLRGFSFYRALNGKKTGKWLPSLKVFKSIVKDARRILDEEEKQFFTTKDHPVQSFLWGDYTAVPGNKYEFKIYPRYGSIRQLETDKSDVITITVRTEAEEDPKGHSIWFNRGAIASQYFSREFGDVKPSTKMLEDVSQPMTQWLSRGLLEACLRFIDETKAGQGLRACVYEFTYKPVLDAIKAAIERGVDVKISYHDTPANNKAMEKAGLFEASGRKKVFFPRTVPKIPHNKFFVRLKKSGNPEAVWTGSTNITPSGFLGQSNVGHQVNLPEVAATYLAYWEQIAKDPASDKAKAASTRISPHPEELLSKNSITPLFSPRHRSAMLKWYANRMLDAEQTVMFTAAFGVNEKLVLPLAQDRDFLRYVLMEKRPLAKLTKQLRGDKDLIVAYGSVLGEVSTIKDGKRVVTKLMESGLDEWFKEEEHYRKAGNIFFVHTKFLLIDPLSKDPLICSGSANFSDNSLTQNDENMLLIRGDTRVADIYMTEFDRIFRHFQFRNIANEIALKGNQTTAGALDESASGAKHWTNAYFEDGNFKKRRHEMFFTNAKTSWAANAALRPVDETKSNGDTPFRTKSVAAKKTAGKASKSRARKAASKIG